MMRAGKVFPAFPYEPYNVQQDFMESLYDCLQKGGIGLFESPTGDKLFSDFLFIRQP